MKRLYMLRGVPGCGKSTLIDKLGLHEFTLSTDEIRLKISGIEIIDGVEVISQKKNFLVFKILKDSLIKRMKQNLPVIIDATNITGLNTYKSLADEHGYEFIIVDFKVSLNVLLERNKARQSTYKSLPENKIISYYDKKKTSNLPEGARVIRPSDLEKEWKETISDICDV